MEEDIFYCYDNSRVQVSAMSLVMLEWIWVNGFLVFTKCKLIIGSFFGDYS